MMMKQNTYWTIWRTYDDEAEHLLDMFRLTTLVILTECWQVKISKVWDQPSGRLTKTHHFIAWRSSSMAARPSF
jgi:hypothetical protein